MKECWYHPDRIDPGQLVARGVTKRCYHGMYFSTFWSLSVFLTFVVKLRLEKNISYGGRLEELSADKTPGLLKYMTFSKV